MKVLFSFLLILTTTMAIGAPSYLCICKDQTRGSGDHNLILFFTKTPQACQNFGGASSSNTIYLTKKFKSAGTHSATCHINGKSYACGYQLKKIHPYYCQLF